MSKIGEIIDQLGLLNGFLYIADRILGSITHGRFRIIKYYLFVQPVALVPLLPKNRGNKISVREINRNDIETKDFIRPQNVIQQRYEQGAHCFSAYKEDKFIGFVWLIFNKYEEDEVRCNFFPLPAGKVAWDFDIYVDPKYRIGFAFTKLWDEANSFMRSKGATMTMSRISAYNSISVGSHARLGAKKLGWLLFFVFGSVQVMVSSVAPFIHVSFRKDSVPNINLYGEL